MSYQVSSATTADPSRGSPGPRVPRAWRQAATICVLAAVPWVCVGCGSPEPIDDTYGRRSTPGQTSVNGTSVLAEMFHQAGHRVVTLRRLSPRLERANVAVWIPDDFEPPSREVCAYLEQWLENESGRTLVYVGRDYDAAVTYWQTILERAPPGQALEIKRRLAAKWSDHDASRRTMVQEHTGPWFRSRHEAPPRQVRTLAGPWSAGIDAAQVNIRLQERYQLAPRAERDTDTDMADSDTDVTDSDTDVTDSDTDVTDLDTDMTDGSETTVLLESEGDLLAGIVRREGWWDSQVIVVTNGCFLLNLPLVNHQHRRLAGRLIQECGPPGQEVVFLESGPGGLPIADEQQPLHPWLQAFTQWPISGILLHLIALGIVFCVSVFPVFGRPRDLPAGEPSDFGRHVEAFGSLLERTADVKFAESRLAQYQQTVRRDQLASPLRSRRLGAPPAGARNVPGGRPDEAEHEEEPTSPA